MNKLSIGPQLRTTSVLVVYLLLLHCSRGQSKLIGPSQPIVATVGDDVILPCHLEPAVDVAGMTLAWSTSDLEPRLGFVLLSGQDMVNTKHPSYKGRTSLFTNELKHGNISLKLSKVKPADEGTYQCYVPKLNETSLVELVVGASASPVISLTEIDGDKDGVVLQCESKGWYPEPELLWLDAKGKNLSAGPTETVRGPDDLYTVSSRVTVEKKHSNNIICRVQQSNINQIRETQIHISDYFFNLQSGYSTVTVGLTVSFAVCLLLIPLLLVIFCKMQKIIRLKRRQWAENDHAAKKNLCESNTEDQICMEEEREREQLIACESEKVEDFINGNVEKKTKCKQQMRQEAENSESVKNLKEELETKKKEVEMKQAELQQLQEGNQNIEENLQTLRKKLESKNKELERIKATKFSIHDLTDPSVEEHQKKRRVAEREAASLRKQLETKIKEFKEKQVEVQQLEEEIQRMETNITELNMQLQAEINSRS
uniref:Ig-like domain-containing protein n=1 Tax=Anabas testudineus TaxID=64144 RepID=A0A3Q1IMN2_ANATE